MTAKQAMRDPAPADDQTARAEPHRKSRLEISLFGGVALHYAGRKIELHNRKAMALVGYLALATRLTDTRERIVGLLWSETEETKARATLRQVLKDLRSAFEQCRFNGFTTGRVDVGFDTSAVTLDVWSALDSVAAGRPDDALLDRSRITETLLAGYDDVDPSFRAWLFVHRENLHRRLIRGLEDQLAGNARNGLEVLRLAQAVIQLDPTHEVAYQRLMRCYADAGDVAGALAAYKRLWDLLGDEYDMEPSDKTQELVASIKSGTAAVIGPLSATAPGPPEKATAGVPGAASPKLSLVVAPFDIGGVHPDQKHIGIGFRYELIARLVRFREWSLIDGAAISGSTHGLAGLQPHYQIMARFFQNRDALSVIVTLQASGTGVVVWSERYDVALDSFFATQQQILNRIAASLNVNLSVERLSRIASAPDVSLDIYDRWLQGQALIGLFRPNDHARATTIFESIIDESPNLSAAYSGLVQLENTRHIVFPGTYRTVAHHQKALSMARTAVRLDPIDSRAQLCLAWSFAFNGQFEMAIAGFRHASGLNEDDPWTTTSAALGLAYSDELAEARRLADHALELSRFASPLHWCYQATVRFLGGDYEGSIRAAEQSGDAINYFLGWRAAALAHAGRLPDAEAEGSRFMTVVRGIWSGQAPPTDEAVSRWLLHCFPIRNRKAVGRLQKGLELAGIAVPH